MIQRQEPYRVIFQDLADPMDELRTVEAVLELKRDAYIRQDSQLKETRVRTRDTLELEWQHDDLEYDIRALERDRECLVAQIASVREPN
jgi:hypothetical protein